MKQKQKETEALIRKLARVFNEITPDKQVDENLGCAVADPESSMGLHQKSPTGALGVFQLTSIAMKDLLWEMEKVDDDLVDIVCGLLFLRLLKDRHRTTEMAVFKYCDPKDRETYVPKVMKLIKEYKAKEKENENKVQKVQQGEKFISDLVDSKSIIDNDELLDTPAETSVSVDNIRPPGTGKDAVPQVRGTEITELSNPIGKSGRFVRKPRSKRLSRT